MLENPSCLRVVNHLSGKHQDVFNTTRLKTSHLFRVCLLFILTVLDEIKWGIRMPSKHAVPERDFRYEERVQSRINDFLG
jgi:hypothetical protein